jgi:hypothetical protein
MADATDSKSVVREDVGVQVPSPVPCGCSSMVELQPSKLVAWVRFPSPAPKNKQAEGLIFFGQKRWEERILGGVRL